MQASGLQQSSVETFGRRMVQVLFSIMRARNRGGYPAGVIHAYCLPIWALEKVIKVVSQSRWAATTGF
jgi:hypothetical protein